MKLRRELIGIILAFSTAGIVATNADAKAYDEVHQERETQVAEINKAISSEFISNADQKLLKQEMKANDKAEQSDTRRSLRSRAANEKKLLSKVKSRLAATEAKTAKKEFNQLSEDVASLEKKSQETFILATDSEQAEKIKDNLATVADSKKVKPIRELAGKADDLSTEMKDNQTQMIDLVSELKEANQSSTELAKKKYVLDSEKEELTKDQKANAEYFDDADNLKEVTTRRDDSQSLISRLQTRQEETEKDFKENESPANELVQSTATLLSTGNLNAEEKDELTKAQQSLSNSLGLKDYEPGDLAANYQTLKKKYDESLTNSNKRNEEAKKKADEEAAAHAKEEAAKQQAEASANSPAPAPTLVGQWYQAPAGYKFLKVESSLTYGQVKNPGNFRLITDAEAANYRPGHGNGSAKQ